MFALLEQLISDLSDRARDLERGLWASKHVLAVHGVLVLRVVLVHVAVGHGRLGERRIVRGKLSTVRDHARLNGNVTAGGLGVLDRAHDGLAAEDLAEDDVLVIEVGRGVAGDEELRAVRVCSGVGLG